MRALEQETSTLEPETSATGTESPRDTRARAQLEALMAYECEGVQEATQTACPIEADRVRGVREIEGGIAVRLDARPSEETDLEKRTDCYLAHAVIQRSASANAWDQGEYGTGRYGPGSSASYGTDGTEDTTARAGSTDSEGASDATEPGASLEPQESAEGLGPAPAFCLIDATDIEVDVEDNNGRIELEIVTGDTAKLAQLRERARTMTEERARAPRSAAPGAQTGRGATPTSSTP